MAFAQEAMLMTTRLLGRNGATPLTDSDFRQVRRLGRRRPWSGRSSTNDTTPAKPPQPRPLEAPGYKVILERAA
jgi:hypothetical protein